MEKIKKITYWITTGWLALGMFSTGLMQLLRQDADVEKLTHLGYPEYLLTILGVWKMLGVVAILIPKFPIVKEWAYAGFFFAMSGAIVSHLASNNAITETLPSLLLLVLTVLSWFLRPAERKVQSVN